MYLCTDKTTGLQLYSVPIQIRHTKRVLSLDAHYIVI